MSVIVDAFGIAPSVFLAGLSFAGHHVGTYPPSGLSRQNYTL